MLTYLLFNSPKQGRQSLAGLCWQEPGRGAPVPKALSPAPNQGSRAVNSTAFTHRCLGKCHHSQGTVSPAEETSPSLALTRRLSEALSTTESTFL